MTVARMKLTDDVKMPRWKPIDLIHAIVQL